MRDWPKQPKPLSKRAKQQLTDALAHRVASLDEGGCVRFNASGTPCAVGIIKNRETGLFHGVSLASLDGDASPESVETIVLGTNAAKVAADLSRYARVYVGIDDEDAYEVDALVAVFARSGPIPQVNGAWGLPPDQAAAFFAASGMANEDIP